jgi:hypothetical protein
LQRLADSHHRLEDAERIARFLIDDRHADVLHHVAQARLLCVVSERAVLLHGHPAAAYICRPRVQGPMSAFVEDLVAQFAAPQFEGHDPDFVIRFDRAIWDDLAFTEPALEFWQARRQFTPESVDWSIGRERLVFHELKHLYQPLDADGAPRCNQEDGRPVLALRPHDIERFHDELACYGAELCDATDAAIAIAEGIRSEQAARRRKEPAA